MSQFKNHQVDDLVDFTDFMATFADAMNIQVPAEWDTDGHSFLPVLRGEKNPNEREWVFVHYQPNHVPQANLEKYSCRFFKDHTYKYYSTGAFYNYKKDPEERRGLTMKVRTKEEKALSAKYKAMMDKLPKWELGDKCVKKVVLPGYEPVATKKKGQGAQGQGKGQGAQTAK